uniref:Uncharacterized protein n=1 Tax=viral metagenome TaxID=1070528 RepID=A0A6C0BNU3_9ZZZZ
MSFHLDDEIESVDIPLHTPMEEIDSSSGDGLDEMPR